MPTQHVILAGACEVQIECLALDERWFGWEVPILDRQLAAEFVELVDRVGVARCSFDTGGDIEAVFDSPALGREQFHPDSAGLYRIRGWEWMLDGPGLDYTMHRILARDGIFTDEDLGERIGAYRSDATLRSDLLAAGFRVSGEPDAFGRMAGWRV